MANYRLHDRTQIEMKMMCINDFVPKDHQARLITSIVDSLDLSGFDDFFNNDLGGKAAYPIKSLIAILVYASLNGVYGNRKIERSCHDNIVFRYLCCDDPPDHSTISRFWNRFKKNIENILKQTVYIGEEEGLIDYKHLAGDGVRLESLGSRNKMYNEKSALHKMEQIDKTVTILIEKIENVNSQEEKELINNQIDHNKEMKERIDKGLKDFKKLQEKIKAQIKQGKPQEKGKYFHITEPETKLMVRKDGAYITGYNAQAMVDSKTNMIIASEATACATDKFNGIPLLKKSKKTVGIKKLRDAEITLDNGYMYDDLVLYGEEKKLDLYISVPHQERLDETELKRRKDRQPDLTYDEKKDCYICKLGKELPFRRIRNDDGRAYGVYQRSCGKCEIASECIKGKRKRKIKYRRIMEKDNLKKIEENRNQVYVRMKEKMKLEESKEIYKKRLPTVEPVFAHIEDLRGFRRFSVWGRDKANGQWGFMCFTHNLHKIMKYGRSYAGN